MVASLAIWRSSTLQSLNGAEEDLSIEVVEAEDLSTEEFAVNDDESSMEEPEVQLEGGELSERDESVAEAERGRLLSAD